MTLTELQALSPDELRVLVAELCEWTHIKDETDPRFLMDYRTLSGFKHGAKWFIPNYPGSLDSCREFEDAMTDEESQIFDGHLLVIAGFDRPVRFFRNNGSATIDFVAMCKALRAATPQQRCIAYILTKTEGAE